MAGNALLTERDFVLLPLAEKNRPAVVLDIIDDERALVIYGTGTPRDLPRVEVGADTREAKSLGLYKPTYFYASGVRVALISVLIRQNRRCPPELFLRLRTIAAQYGI